MKKLVLNGHYKLMLKKYYKQAIILIIALVAIGGYFYPQMALGARTSNFFKTIGSKIYPINDRAIVASGDLEFQDEIMPDGDLCANGEILKKTGADNWDCAADDGGSSSGGGSSIWSTTTPDLILYYNGGKPLIVGGTATTSDDTLFEIIGGSQFDNANFDGAVTMDTTLGVTGLTTLVNASTTLISFTTAYGNLIGNVTGTASGNLVDSDISHLSDIGDVSTTSLATGDILTYQGTGWQSTSSLSVDENGNVGIGTSTPQADLYIVGGATTNLILDTDSDGETSYRQTFRNVQGANLGWYWGDRSDEDKYMSITLGGGQNRWDNKTRDMVIYSTNVNPIMQLEQDTGYIGIATATPAYQLDVYGNARIDGALTMTFASSTGLTSTNGWFTNLYGTLTGNVTGNVTGDVSGNAGTATALAANGANCNAGEYPLGVDASGAVESCTDATTEINSVVSDYLPLSGGVVTGSTTIAADLTTTATTTINIIQISGGGCLCQLTSTTSQMAIVADCNDCY